MRFIDRFLEGVLEELHGRFDGLPLERIRREARELLEAELLDLDAALELFLERLGLCRLCGNAWPTWDMEEREGPEGPSFVCGSCSGGAP